MKGVWHTRVTRGRSIYWSLNKPLIVRFMGPTWGPSGTDRTQVGPRLAPWTNWPTNFEMNLHFLVEYHHILIFILLKFLLDGVVDNIQALASKFYWHWATLNLFSKHYSNGRHVIPGIGALIWLKYSVGWCTAACEFTLYFISNIWRFPAVDDM